MSSGTLKSVAIIGTAGRDRNNPNYTRNLWNAMLKDAIARFKYGEQYKLVSGGAAWADQLAVELFLSNPGMFELELYLPAPLTSKGVYEGNPGSAGSTSNWYHELFEKATGVAGRNGILQAVRAGASVSSEPKAAGMGAFFARNAKVASAVGACLAYTWAEGKEPADGGTKHTWGLVQGRKVHVPLGKFVVQ
jgi:hypothetical protein